MKKIILLLFAFMIILTFCSCSNSEEDVADNSQQQSQNSVNTYFLSKQYIETHSNGVYARYEMNFDEYGNILSGNVKGKGLMEGNNFSIVLSQDEYGRIIEAKCYDIKNNGEQEEATIKFSYEKMDKSNTSESENSLCNKDIERYIKLPNTFYVSVPTFSVENPHEDFIEIIYDENNRVIAKRDFTDQNSYYYSYFPNGSIKNKVICKEFGNIQVNEFDEYGNVIITKEYYNGKEIRKSENTYVNGLLVMTEDVTDTGKFIYLFKGGILNGYKTIIEDNTTEYICEQIRESDEGTKVVVKSPDGVVLFEEEFDKLNRKTSNTIYMEGNAGTLRTTISYYEETNKMMKQEVALYNNSGEEISRTVTGCEYAKNSYRF